MGATWLPGEQGKQYLNAYLNHDKVEVMVADGKLVPTQTGKDSLEVNATLEHFPLRVANVFIPDKMATLAGDMDGNLMYDKDGNKISYNPPRYEYSYDFYITIFVNNPYFDEMRFKINSDSVDVTPPPAMRPGMATRYDPESNVEYRNCKKLGEEIRQMLTQVRKDVRERIEQAAAPKAAITCPYCCATTTPDASGRCEYCGGALNG